MPKIVKRGLVISHSACIVKRVEEWGFYLWFLDEKIPPSSAHCCTAGSGCHLGWSKSPWAIKRWFLFVSDDLQNLRQLTACCAMTGCFSERLPRPSRQTRVRGRWARITCNMRILLKWNKPGQRKVHNGQHNNIYYVSWAPLWPVVLRQPWGSWSSLWVSEPDCQHLGRPELHSTCPPFS